MVRTEWKTADIWLRRKFDWPDEQDGKLVLMVHHDEDVEIYLNGVLAAKVDGFVSEYEEMAIAPRPRRL